MKKTIFVLLMVLLSVMLVVSCDDNKEAEKIEYDDLLGWWEQKFDEGYFRIKFNKDNTVTLDERKSGNDADSTMTATLSDNILTLTSTDPSGTGATSMEYKYELSFDGDKLVLTQKSDESMSAKYVDKKTFTMKKVNLG